MVSQDKLCEQLIVVPAERLNPEVLSALIEEFVTRSGTDYGQREALLAEKCAAVRTQLVNKRALITYDPLTQTCTIVPADDVRSFNPYKKEKATP